MGLFGNKSQDDEEYWEKNLSMERQEQTLKVYGFYLIGGCYEAGIAIVAAPTLEQAKKILEKIERCNLEDWFSDETDPLLAGVSAEGEPRVISYNRESTT